MTTSPPPPPTLAACLEHLQNAILLADDQQRYVYANPAAETHLGYSREELLRMTVWDLTPAPDVSAARELWRTFIAEGHQSGEFRIARKDGEVRVFQYSAVANVAPGLHLSDLHDITDLVSAREVEEARVRDREWLIHEMHHHLNNMLATVLATLRGQAAGSRDAAVSELVHRVSTRVQTMAEAARLLRDAAPASARVSLEAMLDEILRTTVASVALEPKRVRWSVAPSAHEVAWSHTSPLVLLVGELVTNFLEHSLRPGDDLHVAVSADFAGDELAALDLAFSRPFATPPTSWTPDFGMRLVERLALQLGGTLEHVHGEAASVHFRAEPG